MRVLILGLLAALTMTVTIERADARCRGFLRGRIFQQRRSCSSATMPPAVRAFPKARGGCVGGSCAVGG